MATSSATIIIFRIIQGVGAGMLLPNAMTIVAETFEPHERGQALGVWSAMAAAGSAIGPTVGGYLIEHYDWRMVFFSVAPICIISIILGFITIPTTRRQSRTTIDYLGSALLIISISSLLVALNQGQKEGWDSLYIVSLFYTTVAAFILFLAVEFWVSEPMIDVRLFRNLTFTAANVIGFVSFVGFFAGNFLLPFFLKTILDYGSTTSGLMLLPLTVAMMIFSPLGGRLADRFGSRLPAFFGIMMIACALYSLTTISAEYGTGDFFIRLSLFGTGLGLTMSPLTTCVVASLPKDKIGVGSGIFNLAKIIGGGVGVVLAQTLLSRREVYHSAVLKEYLNPATRSPNEIFQLLQALWGNQGMDSSMLSTAAHGWLTGHGLLPGQYVMLKLLLSKMVARQASILSFQDVFYTISLISFAGGLLALLIRRRPAIAKLTSGNVR
jgi:EmrB/QacA subfamily drug resistance transporter